MQKLITERDVAEASRKRQKKIYILPKAIVTPAAKDAARVRKIQIIREAATDTPEVKANKDSLKVVLGCDHGGFELKQVLSEFLRQKNYRIEDVGTFSTDSVDYPDYAHLVAKKVASDLASVGIIVDGAGVGSAMAANKVPGIRAAACYDVYTARNSREHNFANVLTMGSRVTGIDIAKEIAMNWLTTAYGEERHARRVEKVTQIEKSYSIS